MKIRLDDVMQSFSFPFEAAYYYYIPLETVLMFVGGLIYGKAVNGIASEEDVRKHSDSFIELPRIGEEGRRKVMKGFLEAVSNPELKKRMISAADADAVAEFENLLREKRLLIAWYNYRDDVYSEFAKRWCEANGLELVR
ncbi:MAG: hypothetical protein IJ126_01620 [Lachnospiraceae bacterium]|jgi:hypothetical protein|nr:hypothetical protein [Lachnospiraceae bacterium]